MFRQGLRRCASAASRITATPSMRLTAQRWTISQTASTPLYSVAPKLSSFVHFKQYSTERDESAAPAESEESMRFDELSRLDLNPTILSNITDGLGYETMSPVQAKTIAPALKGTDIVAQAKTGTGKTIAFLLPLLQRMLHEDPSLAHRKALRQARCDDIRGIVLSPTRELAMQIAEEAKMLVKNTGLVVQIAVGGTQKSEMLRRARRMGCHLLIATPGRLHDLLSDPRSGIEAPNLAAMVLDEADRMLDTGFEQELKSIVDLLPSPDQKVRQTMLVSATIPDNVIRLARTMVRPDDFEFIQTIPENESLTHDRIPQNIVKLDGWKNVFPSVFELIDRESAKAKSNPDAKPFKAIVYFNTTALVQMAGELAYMRRKSGDMNVQTYAIHSALTQNQRTRAADFFRSASSAILFSSDVTARGMDFPDVTHVIQVDCPRDRESYIHRLGRTGRQGKDGEGWILLPPSSLRTTRNMLKGLPIKPNESLESATASPGATGETSYVDDTAQLYSRLPSNLLGSTYTSVFGAHMGSREELAQELQQWVVEGWGWEAPPPVSTSWARNLGISTRYLNINSPPRTGFSRDERSSRDDRDDRDDRGDRGDAFDNMRRNVRRDDRGRSSDRFGGRGRDSGRFPSKRRERFSRRDSYPRHKEEESSW